MPKKGTKKTKHPWKVLEPRFFSGEFDTLEEMSAVTKVSISTLKKRSASKGWFLKRAELELRAEKQRNKKIATLISNEGSKRIPGWFQMADALKFKAMEAFTQEATKGGGTMSLAEATRALQAAFSIEANVLQPKSGRRRSSSTEDPDHAFSPDAVETKETIEARRAELHRKLARLAGAGQKKAGN